MIRRKLATKNQVGPTRGSGGVGKGVTDEDEEAVARFMPGGAATAEGGMIGVDPQGMS